MIGLLVIVDNTPADSVVLRHRQTANHTLSIDFDPATLGFDSAFSSEGF